MATTQWVKTSGKGIEELQKKLFIRGGRGHLLSQLKRSDRPREGRKGLSRTRRRETAMRHDSKMRYGLPPLHGSEDGERQELAFGHVDVARRAPNIKSSMFKQSRLLFNRR